ncbi:uncharacterized protein BJX67DRAFT_377610 [Aspergillus lucknowensis]|uniref:Uncharacterized protein n=1 Tax=Aspergillus lucknowensis TaxID=176173 RepID=A0ABR4M2G0_9EURO
MSETRGALGVQEFVIVPAPCWICIKLYFYSGVPRGTQKTLAHYNGVKGLNASWTGVYQVLVLEDGDGVEGGDGDFGTTSGGSDQLGFGTALFRLEEPVILD